MNAAWSQHESPLFSHGRSMNAAWSQHECSIKPPVFSMVAPWKQHGRSMEAAWFQHEGRMKRIKLPDQDGAIQQLGWKEQMVDDTLFGEIFA